MGLWNRVSAVKVYSKTYPCYRKRFRTGGFSLVEVVIAMAMVLIAATGMMLYQYHTVRQLKISRVEISAMRLGQFLLEDWKSIGGSETYDAVDLDIGFEKPLNNNDGDYFIEVDGVTIFFDCDYRDVDTDTASGVTLRELTVLARWNNDFSNGTPGADSATLPLVTYVRRDSASG